jgi:pimeloyl-ACP methyl ester carboxylesterase
MSVDVHHTEHRADVAAPATPPTGPIARIVAGSLAAGATTALVLTLVVFAGGTESVITGSILVGFGLGWALIAVLTERHTNQPQRWAAVPAAAMAATGFALLAFTPEHATMTRLSWVWPPVVLALTVWMLVRMRRALTGRSRWLLTPVVAVLALAALGATYENVTLLRDQHTYPAPGKTYEVHGHRLHLDCHGRGAPTVLLSNGLGEFSASWARIAGPVAATTRVCAYDRAGQGWSSDADSPQDGVTAARDLHALLAVAGEHGPYVLVGHSTGGTYAMTYAARHPAQVAGLVLLDSSSPEQFTRMPAFPRQYAMMRRAYALMPTLSRLGLGQIPATSHLPAADAAKVTAITSAPQAYRNQRDEVSVIPEVFAQAQALTTLGNRPLAVLTASDNVGTDGWVGAQDELAGLSPNSVHRTVDSTHTGLLEDVRPAAESVRAITEVVSSVRTGTALPSR